MFASEPFHQNTIERSGESSQCRTTASFSPFRMTQGKLCPSQSGVEYVVFVFAAFFHDCVCVKLLQKFLETNRTEQNSVWHSMIWTDPLSSSLPLNQLFTLGQIRELRSPRQFAVRELKSVTDCNDCICENVVIYGKLRYRRRLLRGERHLFVDVRNEEEILRLNNRRE